jgi:hypothetical protein
MAQEDARPSKICQLVPRPDPLPHLVPQSGICILAGSPLVGKTALLATILRSFRDNTPVLGHQPNRLPAIGIICTDRGWDQGAGHWFNCAGYPEITRYVMADDPFFQPRELKKKHARVDWFFDRVDRLKLPPGSLLVADTIGPLLSNFLDYDASMVTLLETRAGLRPRELTLFSTAHSSKLRADKHDRYLRPIDQIAGSTALTGFSDSALYLASPEETGRSTYTLSWNSHTAPQLTIALDRDPKTGLFQLAEGGDKRTMRRVLQLFPDEGSTTTGMLVQQAQRLPLSERTVRRALDALLQAGWIRKLRLGQYTLASVLPDDYADPSDATPDAG